MSPQNLRELFNKVRDDLEGLETFLEFYWSNYDENLGYF